MNAEDLKQAQQPSASSVPSKQRRYLKPEVRRLRLAEVIQGDGSKLSDGIGSKEN